MNHRLRILHLRASNFVGGPEKQLLSHAKMEHAGPFEIILGTFAGKGEGREFLGAIEKQGSHALALPAHFLGKDNALAGLVRVVRGRKIDLLCTHGYKADALGTLAARWAGIPAIFFLRGWTGEDWKVRSYEALDRLLLPLASRIVCLSETQAKRLSSRRSLVHKIRVVPNSVDVPVISSEQRAFARRQLCSAFGIPADAPIVAAGGRLSPEKGASHFLLAVPEILRQHPSARFILFGDGVLKGSLVELAFKLGIISQVHFAGFVSNFRELLPGITIVVNPSLSEEMPNVVLEAMAAELPVVATDVGGVSEMSGRNKTIEMVPPGQPSAIALAVVELLSKPVQAASLGQSARRRVEQAFSPSHQRDCLRELYEEVLCGRSPEHVAEDSTNIGRQTSAQETPKDRYPRDSFPFISVVIPVRNEGAHLGAVLQDLLLQEYPSERYEILIADGNSTDNTARVVEEAALASRTSIRLLPNPGQLSSAGRNVGVRASSGEVIIFIDGHCQIPGRSLLRDTARLFQTTDSDCLCRPQPLTASGNSWFQQVVADVRASIIGHGLDSTIFAADLEGDVNPTSSGASYRRKVFDKIGMYDERLDACEDVEFNYRVYRAGLRSYASPRLQVRYSPRNTLSGLWKQMVRYGKGRRRFAGIHPEAFSVSQTIPAIFMVWLLFGGLAAMASTLFATFYLSTVVVYAGVVGAASLWLGMKRGWRHLVAAPAVYLTIHLGLGFGFFSESIRSLRLRFPARWASVERGSSSVEAGVAALPHASIHPEPAAVVITNSQVPGELNEPQPGRSAVCSSDNKAQVHAFTVDVEDYFHTEAMASVVPRERWDVMPSRVQNNTQRLFELLGERSVCGTFFFLGWVAERYPDLVREAVRLGHEVGCHSFWHRPVFRLSPEEFRADTLRAKHAIEDAGGVRVRGYRAPSFSMVSGTSWAIDILAELGFDYDSSVHPIRHDLYSNALAPREPHRIGDGAILELPIATTCLGSTNLPIGGGGYLRILPYAYTHWGLTRFSRIEGRPAVVYLHPWEIDPRQPRLEAPLKSRLRQYVGLSTMERKLTILLQDFRFASISTVFYQKLGEAAGSGDSRFEKVASPQARYA